MIIKWQQHKLRANAPQHIVLGRNIVKGYVSAPLVVESIEGNAKFRGFIVNVSRMGLR